MLCFNVLTFIENFRNFLQDLASYFHIILVKKNAAVKICFQKTRCRQYFSKLFYINASQLYAKLILKYVFNVYLSLHSMPL